jgi:hypothetical protein
MQPLEFIEDLLQNDLKGLCTTCGFASKCFYRKETNKIIIQCELYQLGEAPGVPGEASAQRSLCKSCSKSDTCQLPGRHMGIWRCEMYE